VEVVVTEFVPREAAVGRADGGAERVAETPGAVGEWGVAVPVRYRVRRASARPRAVKVLYGEDELATVALAAARAGLRPSSYVAAAALASAQGAGPPTADCESRELLTELMRSRAAIRQYGNNLNQIAAALHSGVTESPVWLAAAVAGADRATVRVDEVASVLRRRLG
jgi:hypothetical protein